MALLGCGNGGSTRAEVQAWCFQQSQLALIAARPLFQPAALLVSLLSLKPHATTSQAYPSPNHVCCFPNCEDAYNLQNGDRSLGGKGLVQQAAVLHRAGLSMPHQQWEEATADEAAECGTASEAPRTFR